MSPHILILVHRTESLDDPCHYFLKEIAAVWQEEGVRVTVQAGPGAPVSADVAIMHVDLTVVPADHLAYMRQFRKTINGHVADISKRSISRNLVAEGDGYDGPVILKANYNAGGWREHRLADILGLKNGPRAVVEYRIYDRLSDMPEAAWFHRDLVVEKFLPERCGEHYCLRTWMFLGDRETNSLSYSREPVVKQRTVIRREVVDHVPDELRELREEMAFDFGKFDYGIVDGHVVLYDANRTPSLGNFARDEVMPRIRHLAGGLRAFL